ncbi:hypothetical protein ACWF50_04270 [Brucella pseudogrignonensis]|jgi:predicted dienelactone hydrolase|nr:hypothetical protein [Brucella pseudogrignonensis]
MLLRLFALVTAILCLVSVANAESFNGSGLKKLAVVDPVDSRPMEAVVFYPSAAKTEATKIGPYQVQASPTAPMAEGRFPLILLSHGNMGSMWGITIWAHRLPAMATSL